jgi:uncharacterized membrane protein YeaQ/YmgE (transglycosylase-associated protein family)
MGLHGSPWLGAEITFYIWCAVGAVLGWLAGGLMGSRGKVQRLEEMLVGVFGAFIGGEFVAAQFRGGVPSESFTVPAFLTAIGGAVLMLVLLRMMRSFVGPLRPSKPKPQRRY